MRSTLTDIVSTFIDDFRTLDENIASSCVFQEIPNSSQMGITDCLEHKPEVIIKKVEGIMKSFHCKVWGKVARKI